MQRARQPRVIVDYTFSTVNANTTKLAHSEAMQFGKALERIITQIVEADPAYGPVQLIKIDIADGFYRITVNAADIPKLAVAIPQIVGDEPLLALPFVLPMGWTDSPPYFCAATETISNLTNQRLRTPWTPPAHRLENQANTPPPPEPVVTSANQTPNSAAQPRLPRTDRTSAAPLQLPTSLSTTSLQWAKATPPSCSASGVCYFTHSTRSSDPLSPVITPFAMNPPPSRSY
jgi:hypothetical protein